ncbi:MULTISPECIES: Z1 domain-containing protein [unclassified Streptomyces]|uniref:Z1 domain-containing protein n=1 Tax=unclassified Streptomyces TaxID=2593676 RepID=UPI0004C108B2|nr:MULTISPECIES: Z1 domain-containing protein [unclassified Streptomyces]
MTTGSPDDLLLRLHTAALSDMRTSRPKKLLRALRYQAEDLPERAHDLATEEAFTDALEGSGATDPLVEAWRRRLTEWDFVKDPAWSRAPERTADRRGDVYGLLDLSERTRKLLDTLVPVSRVEAPVVITDEFTPWYTPGAERGRPWYWESYRSCLEGKGWTPEAVASLDAASDAVVERLADPTQPTAYQSKGLVVGYVQSGKTANFAGVIAKAVDAGYRLVIVLGGTLNMLRAQTQRRLDMELVGRENILRGASEFESDYADDPAWSQGRFVSFGDLPSVLGGFDIVRLTTRDDDYQSLLQGITALEFEKQEPALPLHDPRNLHRSSARLMVVKKNKGVLTKLVQDLRKIKTPLSEIPVLIVDDESDEASVNTSNPTKTDADRTAINQKISELLRMLPRAQYVGYTATPFANVFVDPSDSEDIFPKDFIVSLPRPEGYMGARDFHDLDSPVPEEERTFANSNERAHVRDILVEGDGDDACLQRAMDMFVLTAAMKLYREDRGGLGDRYFQHHTMLIHESVRTDVHRELLGQVTRLWWNAGYMGPSGHERLRTLFETDVAPVSEVRAGGHGVPSSYEELAAYVGPAVTRIGGDDKPIIVVNGDKDIETGQADFDKRSIWKILIGGQKLARGFTVEGLTVSYFRRRAGNASTLMQMGRWFGFREGYRDLVRLFLGRAETVGAKEIDLYAAFGAICLDEENFRTELRQYATVIDGRPQVTPDRVPPLVSQHLPWLKPTSPNKMYNARLVSVDSSGQWQEPTAYPTKAADLRHNTHLWAPVFDALPADLTSFSCHFPADGERPAVTHRFDAFVGRLAPADFLALARDTRWGAPSQFAPHLAYLTEITEAATPLVDDWLVLAPQHAKRGARLKLGGSGRDLAWFGRDRRRHPLFGAISEPKHRGSALRIAGALADSGDPVTEGLVAPRRGVVILYPLVEPRHRSEIAADGRLAPEKIVTAFSFVAPSTARRADGKVLHFTTFDSSKEGTPIIDTR